MGMNILFFLKPKQEVCTLKKQFTVRQGIEKLKKYGYSAVPVIDDEGLYCGGVSDSDFLRVVLEHPDVHEWEQIPLTELMKHSRSRWEAANIFSDAKELLKLAVTQNFVPVVDDRGMFIGIVTRQDIIRFFAEKFENEAEKKEELGIRI